METKIAFLLMGMGIGVIFTLLLLSGVALYLPK